MRTREFSINTICLALPYSIVVFLENINQIVQYECECLVVFRDVVLRYNTNTQILWCFLLHFISPFIVRHFFFVDTIKIVVLYCVRWVVVIYSLTVFNQFDDIKRYNNQNAIKASLHCSPLTQHPVLCVDTTAYAEYGGGEGFSFVC
eukprot:TRINITY_DN1193_c0_g2_i3.p1 TRINITY_DN1193_c0_g2~~TRINITY_DN1193_c0_g2_i3.p1  ORF type:complete len:147 (-),score=11.25 TRINITY_DN1193_c0_g2_i3:156-596(-)